MPVSNPLSSDQRPWGQWEEFIAETSYRVKRLVIQPDQRLSLQYHEGRSEHWVVVAGKGEAIVGDQMFPISIGNSVFVRSRLIHRLTNTGKTPLIIIETQIGVCDENDIVRVADDYGRT